MSIADFYSYSLPLRLALGLMIEITSRDAIVVGVCFIGATLAAFVLYRRTSPALPFRLRLILGILRWLAVFIILLLVADPALYLMRTRSAKPLVAVLIDDSKSMGYPTAEAKLDRLKSVISDSFIEKLRTGMDTRLFGFSDAVRELSLEDLSHLEPRGSRTDLVSAMESALSVLDRKPSAFILFSDGGINYGDDALHFCSSLRIPVYSVSVANEEPTPDISIDRVEVSEIAYSGGDVPVWIFLSGRHAGEVKGELTISDSTGEILSKELTIPGSGAIRKVTSSIEAGELGLHWFNVAVAAFENESVVANNALDFSMRVIKGKIRVGLIASYPSWDFAFARRTLEGDPNVDVSIVFTTRQGQRIRSGKMVMDLRSAISDLDVVVIVMGAGLDRAAQEFKAFVQDGGGVLFLSVDRSADVIGDMSPFLFSSKSDGDHTLFSPVMTDAGRDHEIMAVDDPSSRVMWSALPPVPVDAAVTGSRREATTLLSGRRGDVIMPLLAVMRYGKGGVVGFSAFDLWRWDLVPKGFGIEASPFSRILLNSVRWLTRRDETSRLSLSTSKRVFLRGEPVDILARILDENLKPVLHANVVGQVYDKATESSASGFTMTDRGGGSQSTMIDLLLPSRYEVKATARIDDRVYGEAATEFTVTERSLEDSDFDGDRLLLQQLADATGGSIYSIEEVGRLPEELNLGSVVTKSSDELRLKLSLGAFILLVGILGTEWVLRKRRMLA